MAKVDYWRNRELEAAAHAELLGEIFEELIEGAIEEDPIDWYIAQYQHCRGIVSVFSPVGMPEEGYPQHEATILSLEAEKAKRR